MSTGTGYTETEYKRRLRDVFMGNWSCAYETRSGGQVGYPDLQFLVGSVLVPVEVKKGEIVAKPDGARLMPTRIRPSQIGWHHEFQQWGGSAFIIVCMGQPSRMDAWVIPGTRREITSRWKEGYPLRDCRQWVRGGEALAPLAVLIEPIRSVCPCLGVHPVFS